MWLVLAREAPSDAPYWPGRRLLAFADAIAWPAVWGVLATQLPPPAGIVGPMIVALAGLSAIRRMQRAVLQNHRYHFTTWRWSRVAIAFLLLGVILKLALKA